MKLKTKAKTKATASRFVESLVESPAHYTVGGIETIDYLKAKASKEEFCGYLRLNVMKYISRAGHKDNTLQEFKKAQWYLNRLVTELDTK
ncbi:MAG: DUF3310 domain-containing protein [Caulobacteraceae bacterium]|nr:DUF3310 domain-containing protein [Caulobacteraceae bacterium]